MRRANPRRGLPRRAHREGVGGLGAALRGGRDAHAGVGVVGAPRGRGLQRRRGRAVPPRARREGGDGRVGGAVGRGPPPHRVRPPGAARRAPHALHERAGQLRGRGEGGRGDREGAHRAGHARRGRVHARGHGGVHRLARGGRGARDDRAHHGFEEPRQAPRGPRRRADDHDRRAPWAGEDQPRPRDAGRGGPGPPRAGRGGRVPLRVGRDAAQGDQPQGRLAARGRHRVGAQAPALALKRGHGPCYVVGQRARAAPDLRPRQGGVAARPAVAPLPDAPQAQAPAPGRDRLPPAHAREARPPRRQPRARGGRGLALHQELREGVRVPLPRPLAAQPRVRDAAREEQAPHARRPPRVGEPGARQRRGDVRLPRRDLQQGHRGQGHRGDHRREAAERPDRHRAPRVREAVHALHRPRGRAPDDETEADDAFPEVPPQDAGGIETEWGDSP